MNLYRGNLKDIKPTKCAQQGYIGYKINTQKLIVFVPICNEQYENEI